MSSPTLRPAAVIACAAPNAIASLLQKTASILSPYCVKAFATISWPFAWSQSPRCSSNFSTFRPETSWYWEMENSVRYFASTFSGSPTTMTYCKTPSPFRSPLFGRSAISSPWNLPDWRASAPTYVIIPGSFFISSSLGSRLMKIQGLFAASHLSITVAADVAWTKLMISAS